MSVKIGAGAAAGVAAVAAGAAAGGGGGARWLSVAWFGVAGPEGCGDPLAVTMGDVGGDAATGASVWAPGRRLVKNLMGDHRAPFWLAAAVSTAASSPLSPAWWSLSPLSLSLRSVEDIASSTAAMPGVASCSATGGRGPCASGATGGFDRPEGAGAAGDSGAAPPSSSVSPACSRCKRRRAWCAANTEFRTCVRIHCAGWGGRRVGGQRRENDMVASSSLAEGRSLRVSFWLAGCRCSFETVSPAQTFAPFAAEHRSKTAERPVSPRTGEEAAHLRVCFFGEQKHTSTPAAMVRIKISSASLEDTMMAPKSARTAYYLPYLPQGSPRMT